MNLNEETLRALSCDITIRPLRAPGCDALMPFVRELRTQDGALIFTFDQAGKSTLQAFVEAELLCCTNLNWEITEVNDTIELEIKGNPAQVLVIREWFHPSDENAKLTNLAQ